MKQPTKNIGRKFNEDGTVRFFPGNTVICKIRPDHPFFSVIQSISERMRNLQEAASAYSFLPESSFHMTMIQGVCEEDRKEALWTKHLPLDTELMLVDEFFERQWKTIGGLEPVVMKFDYIDISNEIIIVRLKPESDTDLFHLVRYRNNVSEKLGLKFPDHDSYGFHISIGYQLWQMEEQEAKAVTWTAGELNEVLRKENLNFQVPQPELTYFDTMFHFSSERIARSL